MGFSYDVKSYTRKQTKTDDDLEVAQYCGNRERERDRGKKVSFFFFLVCLFVD